MHTVAGPDRVQSIKGHQGICRNENDKLEVTTGRRPEGFHHILIKSVLV